MTPITRPRGPLPVRVYWTRRLLLLAVVLAVVFGAARLLGGDGSGGAGPSASPVAADPTSTPDPTTPTPPPPGPTTPGPTTSATPTPTGTPTAGASGRTPAGAGASSTALAAPSGTCANSDVIVSPSVASPAYAPQPVILTMTLTTKISPACTWVVSPSNLIVRVDFGEDRFWSTQDCEGAVPKQAVVVRRDAPTTVSMTWNGLRSDADCSRNTSWAEPGEYRVLAAALGGDPTDAGFRLFKPVRRTITASPTPSSRTTGKATGSPTGTPRTR